MKALKRSLILLSVASLFLLLRSSPARAQVQKLCLHELDGIVAPDDYGNIMTEEACNLDQGGTNTGKNNSWSDLFSAGPGPVPSPASVTGTGGTFSGALQTNNSQFTSGETSKLASPIGTWVYKIAPGGPAKADLQQGAVATYTYTQSPPAFSGGPATGDTIFNYLVTRQTNHGDELHGVWVFVTPVTQTNPSCTDKCTFTGSHAQGDLFLLSGFTGGGGNVGIEVFQWQCSATSPPAVGTLCDTPFDATGGLNPIAFGSCGTGNSGFECGAVNDATNPGGVITVPSQLPNPASGTTLGTGLFYNGAVDITHLLNGITPCFSSVLFEAIASPSCSTTSLGSNLCSSIGNSAAKFFIFGTFNTCKVDASKSCTDFGTLSCTGNTCTHTDTLAGQVINSGGGTVTDIGLTDSPAFDRSSVSCTCSALGSLSACTGCTITGNNCSSATLTGKGSCVNWQATYTSSTNGGTDTVTATATSTFGVPVTPGSKTADLCSRHFNPDLEVSKSCNASLVPTTCGSITALVAQVSTSTTVTNTSAASSTASNVTVKDDTCPGLSTATTCGTGSLAQGKSCTVTCDYTPSVLPGDAGTNTCPNGTFSDTVTAAADFPGTFFNAICPLECHGGTAGANTGASCTDSSTCTNGGTCQRDPDCNCTLVASTNTVHCTDTATASCPLCPLH